jgi:hypothetical protein
MVMVASHFQWLEAGHKSQRVPDGTLEKGT